MRILALVPARSGSIRLPGKNMAMLCGEPLIYWTLRTSRALVMIGDPDITYAVSSDAPKVLDYVYLRFPEVVCVQRPEKLSTSGARSIDVVVHALHEILSPDFDAVLLLQPTSPLRTEEDIRASISTLERTGADAVVSVVDVDHDAVFEIAHGGRLRIIRASRSAHRVVRPNGAIFLLTTEAIEHGKDWWTCDVCYAHVMPRERSIDIDTAEDLAMAQAIMERSRAA